MQKQQDSNKGIRHANFKIHHNAYRHFRLLAASNETTMEELYRRACLEFLERNPVKQVVAE